MNTDGSGYRLVKTAGAINSIGVSGNRLYWIEEDPVSLKYIPADGSSNETVTLFDKDDFNDIGPRYMTIDTKNEILYFSMNDYKDGKAISYIISADVKGTGALTFTTFEGETIYNIEVDSDNGYLYCTDQQSVISRVSISDLKGGMAILETVFEGLSYPSYMVIAR